MDAEKRKWKIELDKQSKLRTYRLFKSEFQLDYVSMDLSLTQRSILARSCPCVSKREGLKDRQKPRDCVNFVTQTLMNQTRISSPNAHFTQITEIFSIKTPSKFVLILETWILIVSYDIDKR